MAIWLLLFPAIIASSFLSLPQSNALDSPIDFQTPSPCSNQQDQSSLACELVEAKRRIARLELILEERNREVNEKNHYIRECEIKIQELTGEVDRLKSALSRLEDDYSRANQKLSVLEEEVRLLWAASRKNNFEIHALEGKASDAERKLKEVASQVEEMAQIVSEQWIQIQQLEQAVHMAERRTVMVKRELWRRCPFVKFLVDYCGNWFNMLKEILDPYISKSRSLLLFCKSHILQIFAASKRYHHQLQGFIEHAMRSSELTSALAHEEVVFFLTSAAVAFPVMAVCMLLLSQFS